MQQSLMQDSATEGAQRLRHQHQPLHLNQPRLHLLYLL
jgi:hypothetical protein